jgi:hypothetical protein
MSQISTHSITPRDQNKIFRQTKLRRETNDTLKDPIAKVLVLLLIVLVADELLTGKKNNVFIRPPQTVPGYPKIADTNYPLRKNLSPSEKNKISQPKNPFLETSRDIVENKNGNVTFDTFDLNIDNEKKKRFEKNEKELYESLKQNKSLDKTMVGILRLYIEQKIEAMISIKKFLFKIITKILPLNFFIQFTLKIKGKKSISDLILSKKKLSGLSVLAIDQEEPIDQKKASDLVKSLLVSFSLDDLIDKEVTSEDVKELSRILINKLISHKKRTVQTSISNPRLEELADRIIADLNIPNEMSDAFCKKFVEFIQPEEPPVNADIHDWRKHREQSVAFEIYLRYMYDSTDTKVSSETWENESIKKLITECSLFIGGINDIVGEEDKKNENLFLLLGNEKGEEELNSIFEEMMALYTEIQNSGNPDAINLSHIIMKCTIKLEEYRAITKRYD